MRLSSWATRRSGDRPHCSRMVCDNSSKAAAAPSQLHIVRSKTLISRLKPALFSITDTTSGAGTPGPAHRTP